jgi:aspartyl-tRNA(Asn)/glutamyl-tRNA(Gln) amidotransferase subunit A
MSGAGAPTSVLGVAEAAEGIAAGRLNPETLVGACLEGIERLDPELNAFRWLMGERAREEARSRRADVERGESLGPLHGVPIAVKDNIELAGDPLTAATPLLEGNVAEADSEVARRLRAAGAIVIGRTHMSEWAIGGTSQNAHYGPVHNPWGLDRVAGGSSGGSAAAVAARLVPAALGSDTGGSIRIPAALSGVCGMRSTVGRVSNRGTIPVAWSFDVVGPLARSARDVSRVLDVIAGFDPGDPVSVDQPVDGYEAALEHGGEGLRAMRLRGFFDDADPAVVEAVDAAVQALEGVGVSVDDGELPGIEETPGWTGDMLLAEAAAFHAERLSTRPEGFQADVRARLERGASVTGPRYALGRQEQRRWRRTMLEPLADYDVLLTPGSPIEAPLLAESEPVEMTAVVGRFFTPFVLTQVPALVVPCGIGPQGLPLAMQLVGRPFAEATLLRVAHAFQQASDWHARRPPTAA